MKPTITFATGLRWLARGLAVCLLLLWGAFFVEHLRDWFVQPFPNHPPLRVCVMVGLHGLMLVGLAMLLRWELAGSMLVLAAAGAFFFSIGGKSALLFFAITALPTLLALWSWRLRRRQQHLRSV